MCCDVADVTERLENELCEWAVTLVKQRKGWRMSCDVGKATESLENELCSFSKLLVSSPTSQLILQPFRRFTYVTVHSPSLPLLYLRRNSFSITSFASPTSQDFHLRHLASRPCPGEYRSFKGRSVDLLRANTSPLLPEVAGDPWKRLACGQDVDDEDRQGHRRLWLRAHRVQLLVSNMRRNLPCSLEHATWLYRLQMEHPPRACLKFGAADWRRAWIGEIPRGKTVLVTEGHILTVVSAFEVGFLITVCIDDGQRHRREDMGTASMGGRAQWRTLDFIMGGVN